MLRMPPNLLLVFGLVGNLWFPAVSSFGAEDLPEGRGEARCACLTDCCVADSPDPSAKLPPLALPLWQTGESLLAHPGSFSQFVSLVLLEKGANGFPRSRIGDCQQVLPLFLSFRSLLI